MITSVTKFDDNSISYERRTFSFSDIDPTDLGPWRVITVATKQGDAFLSGIFLTTTTNRMSVKHEQNEGNVLKSLDNWSMVPFAISDNAAGDNQKRILNALKHAIELCGGKPSPF
jgi:hypothetical protein